jgi:hypothetical protein
MTFTVEMTDVQTMANTVFTEVGPLVGWVIGIGIAGSIVKTVVGLFG